MKERYFLLLDLGGTNANFLLYDYIEKKEIKKFDFKTKNILNFEKFLNKLLEDIKNKLKINVNVGYFAVAGKLNKNRNKIKLTNYDLEINKKEIIKKTNLNKIYLFNDIEPVAFAIEDIGDKNYFILNQKKTNKLKDNNSRDKNNLIISIGTGLGVAINKKGNIISTESGHMKINLKDTYNLEIVKFLEKELNRKIEYEDLISGRGIENIYYFLTNKKLSAKKISQLKTKDEFTKKTFEIFFEYIREFVLMNLKENKYNNIFFGGGVIQNNLLYFKKQLLNIFKKIKGENFFILKNYNITIKGLIKLIKN